MNLITTPQQIAILKGLIQTELLKRGFTSKIIPIKEKEIKSGSNRITFESEEFNTVPVIFKRIHIREFTSSVNLEEIKREDDSILLKKSIHIGIHVSYEHFGMGSNGCGLFNLNGHFFNDDERFHITKCH